MEALKIELLHSEARTLLESLAKMNLIKIHDAEAMPGMERKNGERKYKKMHVLFWETATHMTILLDTNKVENWMFDESMETNSKTSDQCLLKFETDTGEIFHYKGYVPKFFPGEHFGDYILLYISTKGIVRGLNVTDAEIDELLD